jgi:hypothetical protein
VDGGRSTIWRAAAGGGGLGFERDERETDEIVDFERSNSFGEQVDDSRRRRGRR